jgi:HK97 family phage prohead protease
VSEILTRSGGVFADIDFKHRIIDVIAVPWGEPARVFWRGEFWTEVFERGAFNGVETRAGQVRVNREHRKGDTVGKVIESNPHDERGLFTRLKIVNGPKGDEVLHLAAEDMISASVGYRANKGSDVIVNQQAMTRTVRSAFLDHLGLVEDPAFEGSRVLAVREDEASRITVAEGPLPVTPILDEFLSDPVFARILQRRAS